MKTGIELITQERREQVEKHGFSLEHDAQYYKKGELFEAARFCLSFVNGAINLISVAKWPDGWDKKWEDKIRAKTAIGKLMCAGAFFMAENARAGNDTYQPEINMIAGKIDKLLLNRFEKALQNVVDWKLPPSGQHFHDGTEMSYETAFGSNGSRDYFRQVAREALAIN